MLRAPTEEVNTNCLLFLPGSVRNDQVVEQSKFDTPQATEDEISPSSSHHGANDVCCVDDHHHDGRHISRRACLTYDRPSCACSRALSVCILTMDMKRRAQTYL